MNEITVRLKKNIEVIALFGIIVVTLMLVVLIVVYHPMPTHGLRTLSNFMTRIK